MKTVCLIIICVAWLFAGCAHRERITPVDDPERTEDGMIVGDLPEADDLWLPEPEPAKTVSPEGKTSVHDSLYEERCDENEEKAGALSLTIPETRHIENCQNYFLNRYRKDYMAGLERRKFYIGMIREKVRERNVPKAVKWIPMVESWFQSDAQSPARAAGLWQLMPATARSFGLRVDSWIDERFDAEKSTEAALNYLEYLYERTGCWYLSLAAYHSGEGRVNRAVRNNGTDDYWELADNREFSSYTRFYVAAIMALTLIERHQEDYDLFFPEPAPVESADLELNGQLDLSRFCRETGISMDTLKRLNPALKRNVTPPDYPGFVLKIPPHAYEKTQAFIAEYTLGKTPDVKEYTIRPGDTLSMIARRHKTTIDYLVSLNHLTSDLIIAGKKLLIPVLTDQI